MSTPTQPAITLKPSQLRDFLALTIPAKEPVLIAGPPGCGKSDIVLQAALQASADFIIQHPVVSDPTDAKGLPWVVDGQATFLPFGDMHRMLTATKLTVVFLDDLGQATPAVQAAYMQLVLARRINGFEVSPHVVFIAATNRRQDRAGVSGILEPVKSRFTIVELAPDLDDWCNWAARSGLRAEVIAFLRFRPMHLSNFVPTADLSNSPNPRNWESVARSLNLNLPPALQLPAAAGRVGHDVAVEFVAFLRVFQSMVSPDVVLTAPDTAPIPTETSAMYALSIALAQRVQPASMGRMCRYLDRLIKAAKSEFSAVCMQAAIAREPQLANTPGYITAMSGPLGQLMIGGGVS